MKTGERFWQLVGMVLLILVAYGLAELYDVNVAQQKQLESQRQLLLRQESLLKNNHWAANLLAVQKVQSAWMTYLPVEKSSTFAKARLLSDVRDLAKDAGIVNIAVTATDAEGGEKTDAAYGHYGAQTSNQSGSDKSKLDVLPSGVQVIKLTVTGRFDPAPFTKLLRSLEEVQRFTVIERVVVRGTQLEIGIRCYWHKGNGLDKENTANKPTAKAL
ncbi:hypothetical protein LPB67_14245 [Undibacterium sp. Jales W-56]|uniref:hypothetical protein n=1 Tax=Undibacterium sp. Jales W-56 TaxID=2897325 RepID=UPI0021D23C5F|nr:hypothetical protein [Undibacterium sp. Jales W-56]MCU6434934.1 hypothetical protein [Undibacterium sp. Jales W-56]